MNASERIQAAIERLEKLSRLGSDGPWKADRLTAGVGKVAISNDVGRFVAHYVEANDAERIVTLHRTIAAQLAILSHAISDHDDDVQHWADEGKPHLRSCLKVSPIHIAAVALADAILEA